MGYERLEKSYPWVGWHAWHVVTGIPNVICKVIMLVRRPRREVPNVLGPQIARYDLRTINIQALRNELLIADIETSPKKEVSSFCLRSFLLRALNRCLAWGMMIIFWKCGYVVEPMKGWMRLPSLREKSLGNPPKGSEYPFMELSPTMISVSCLLFVFAPGLMLQKGYVLTCLSEFDAEKVGSNWLYTSLVFLLWTFWYTLLIRDRK